MHLMLVVSSLDFLLCEYLFYEILDVVAMLRVLWAKLVKMVWPRGARGRQGGKPCSGRGGGRRHFSVMRGGEGQDGVLGISMAPYACNQRRGRIRFDAKASRWTGIAAHRSRRRCEKRGPSSLAGCVGSGVSRLLRGALSSMAISSN